MLCPYRPVLFFASGALLLPIGQAKHLPDATDLPDPLAALIDGGTRDPATGLLRLSLLQALLISGSQVPISEAIAALESRTEGWIVGLQLAALSLKEQENSGEFIASFTGNHRFVLDYLAKEVFSRQPGEIQEFLLHTSILDRLSAPLCNALTGRGDGQAMLERLEQANLFLIPLDYERSWYRYHPLFAEFLRERLNHTCPDQAPGLHERASAWYEGNGLISQAIVQALSAGLFPRAADLIESSAATMWSWSDNSDVSPTHE